MILDCRGREALSPREGASVGAIVQAGGVILFPTDTLYGLGADPGCPAGIEKVYRAKGRTRDKMLLVLIEGPHLVARFAAAVPPPWEHLMRRFWPGPLTLLFPARPDLLPGIRSEAGEVALRVPGRALCRAVLAAAGGSLTGTSANPSGGGGVTLPEDAVRTLGPMLDLVVDAGALPPSRESTILGWDDGGEVRILREGAIGAQAVREVLKTGSAAGKHS